MKKALALVLALCMVFAMGTVAFAVEDGKITKADPDAESFIVKTVVDPEQDYESWEVTIPADIEIPWGDTAAQSSEYTVNAQLKAGASLTITAAGSGKLGDTIPYTLAGDINVTTDAVETNLTKAITAQVDDFAGYAIDEYQDTVTFTVTYNAA